MAALRARPRFIVVSCLLAIALIGSRAAADGPALTNSVAADGFTVNYPDGWSAMRSGRVTLLFGVSADKVATLSSDELLRTPQVRVSIEQRTSHDDALSRLHEIAAETNDPVTSLTIGGWPAIQRRHITQWPRPGGSSSATEETALTITTAIAAGARLIRLDGSLPGDAPAATADLVAAIETSVSFSSGAASGGSAAEVAGRWIRRLRRSGGLAIDRARMRLAELRRAGRELLDRSFSGAARARADTADEADEKPPLSIAASTASEPSSPGAAKRLLLGGTASEPEVAVSSDGRNIVVGQQFTFISSNDGGLTFPFFGNFPNSTGGDCSLSFGKSSTFYEATISGKSTAVNVSTDNGHTFTFRANSFTCGVGQCGFTGGQIPDQEHIAADRINSTASGDQVYVVFRNGFVPPSWGIECSTDSGSNWNAANVGIAGDFPRVTVGPDGFVYVAYVSGSNMMLDKFAACSGNSSMTEQAGFPKTVATGVSDLPCPVAGLDRCNDGNTLRSPMVAVDDTNSSHIYFSYAINTGAGNENIIVQDSTDGGATWPAARKVTVNGGGTARRYMPWICTTNATAFVSWYDRRAATVADNDLTDYFGATAFLSGGSLTAGAEFQINDSGTADTECEAGQPVGSANSWQCGSRATGDSESCSRQPQLAGRCQHSPPNALDSNTPCDFDETVCPAGETCNVVGGGCPKYGDYNGNACAVGHLYAVWASATPTRTTSPGIDLFFKVRDTVQPVALCKNVTVPTDPDLCSAANVSIDNGSNDPDGDTFTLSQSPPGPYDKGTTPVTLTITDQNGVTASCSANITVLDQQKPDISCPSPTAECTGPSGTPVTFSPTVSDNCPGVGAPICSPPSGSTFPLGVTPFSCNVTDASGNSNSCSSNVTVVDTTPPVINSVVANPNSLWPPNHKLVPVSVVVTATDICDAGPTCRIVSVSSNEPVSGPGSGHTAPDWVITNPGPLVSPAHLGVQLRSERAGGGNGRVYTIAVQCSDGSGNKTPGSTTVAVSHDRRR